MKPDQFALLTDPFPEPMLLISRAGLILSANRAFAQYVGLDPSDVHGARLADLVAQAPEEVDDYLRLCARNRQLVIGMLSFRSGDRSTDCRAEGSLVRAGNENSDALLVLRLKPKQEAIRRFLTLNEQIEDLKKEIRRRQQAEAEVREQAERLRVTLTSIGDAVIVTDAQGRVTLLNPVAEAATGWSSADAMGQSLADVFNILNEYTRAPVDSPVEKVLALGQIVGLANHTVLIARDGSERPIDDSAAPIRDGEGRLTGVVLVFRDITDRKRAEERLRESAQRFRTLAESIPQLAWTARPDGTSIGTTGAGTNIPERRPSRCTVGDGKVLSIRRRGRRWSPVGSSHSTPVSRSTWWCLCGGATGGSGRFSPESFPALKRSEQLRRLAGTAAQVIAAHDVRSVVQHVTDEARDLIGAHQSVTTMVADGNWAQAMTALSRSKDYPDWLSDRLAQGENGLYSLVCRHNRAVRMSRAQLESHPGYECPDAPADFDLPTTGWLAVPLIGRNGSNLGLIHLSDKYDGEFTEDDESMIVQLAQISSVAIENARLYERLTDADRRKDEFLATLAHELRNPLAPIRTGLEVMKLAKDDLAMIERTRDTMERQTQQLITLVDDLLDVSRVTRGRLDLRKCRVLLSEVVQSAIEASKPFIDDARHELAADVAEDPLYLDADPNRLAQVFSNLLNNAAKYTPEGGRILLSAERSGAQVVVSVRDNGIGIPLDMQMRVFEMFTQIDRPMERAYPGLGIGLTLVKSLVEMHGGTVEVESLGVNQGSEFRVRLPLAMGGAPQEPQLDELRGSAVKPRRRVLVVDDNRAAVETLSTVVRMLGSEVRTAGDGQEALEIAEAYRPDVVLMDLGMPRMNGYEAARRIREQPWGEGIMLVALTGWGQDEHRDRTRAAGFDHHLVKPAEPAALQALLDGGAWDPPPFPDRDKKN